VLFNLIFKVKDKESLWKVYVYTARSYCNDINILRDIERRLVSYIVFYFILEQIYYERRTNRPKS